LGVDARDLLGDRRGIGVYLRAVLARFAAREDMDLTLLVSGLFPRRQFAAVARALDSDRFTLATRVPANTDVMWSPWNGTFLSRPGVAAVATIHDVTPFAYPPSDEREREKQQAPFARSARATRVITDSAFSCGEIERYLDVERARLRVVPLAADARFVPGEATLIPQVLRERPYLLFVGANDARKNLGVLAKAHAAAFPSGEVLLACVTSESPAGTIALADVGFTMLRDLYRGALAFVMPSRYEGFGIPPLEAMGCGTPVVASNAASLPEVCGDAALYVARYEDVAEWSAALRRIAGDASLRAELRDLGLERARRFSWERTADETLAALREP
jgi:glycosyltransferase involved in cell wall biosynthesis